MKGRWGTGASEAAARLRRLSARQLGILQHALGANRFGQGGGYRDHFAAGPDDEPICRELIAMGLMRQVATSAVFPYFNCRVTEAGKRAVAEESPQPPRLTRSQQRYRDFLTADSGLPFGDWLKRRPTGA